jgi:histidinol-phosphatase (PHP family)
MPFACIHTHTIFCDGHDDIETNCRRAYEKGLVSLGFSAHAPIEKKTGIPNSWTLSEDRLEAYIEEVQAAKKRWEGLLPIYLGLEVDFIPGLIGPSDRDYRDLGLDYIIGAVHFVCPPKGAPFTVDNSAELVYQGIMEGYGGDPAGLAEDYFNSVEAMIRAGGFDLLAHADVLKKNRIALEEKGVFLYSENDEFYQKKTTQIASLMAEAGIPAELNTGGLNRGKTRDCYPSAAFLKRFQKVCVPMVINADAHKAEDLDGHYAEGREALLNAGYTETLLFEGRKNGKAVWKSVTLR